MKVILTEDQDTLGLRGDVVEVKGGYARNFLIPRRLAVTATPSAVKRFSEERRQAAHKIEAARERSQELADKLNELELVIPVTVGEEDRIHGTVTTQQIEKELAGVGFQIDRKRITIGEDIRVTGVYTAKTRVHPEIEAEFKLKVVPVETAE